MLAIVPLVGWGWAWLAVRPGPFIGVAWVRLTNRLIGPDRLIAEGRAATVLRHERNEIVIDAARRSAASYFAAARRAQQVDETFAVAADESRSSAERAVALRDAEEGAAELQLILTRSALAHAAALLDPSAAAIRAAGHVTAAMCEELAEGRSAAYDERY